MALPDEVLRKLEAVLKDADAVVATKHDVHGVGRYVDAEIARRWASKARTLLVSVFGENSALSQEAARFATHVHVAHDFEQLKGVVGGAVDAFRDGLVFDLRQEAEAEVAGQLLGQAAQDFAHLHGVHEPELRAAAVLAGSVLERHLRDLYVRRGGTEDAEKLMIDRLGVELKKLGAINEIERSRIGAMAAIRNSAAHAATFGATAVQVKSMIESVTDLCARLR